MGAHKASSSATIIAAAVNRDERESTILAAVAAIQSHITESGLSIDVAVMARHVGASVGGLYNLIRGQCAQIARQHELDEAFCRSDVSLQLRRCALRVIANWGELADGSIRRKAIWRRVCAKFIYPKNSLCVEIARLFGILEEGLDYTWKIMVVDCIKERRMTSHKRAMRTVP